MSPKTRQRVLLGLVLCLYALIFGRSVGYEFVWDDVIHIRDNPVFEAPLLEGLATTQHEHMNPDYLKLVGIRPTHDSYRPLLFLSYSLDLALFGRNPHWMHLHNLLVGLLAVLVFYLLARLWLGSVDLAVAAAAVFALHPLQVESTVYLSARSDLLAGLFAMLACLAIGHSAREPDSISRPARIALVALGIFSFLCSLFCKEAYIGLPFALAALLYTIGRLNHAKAALSGLLIAAAGFLVVRASITEMGSSGFGEAALAFPGIFLHYLILSFVPADLSIQRMYDPAYTVPGWVFLGFLAAGGAAALRFGPRRVKWLGTNVLAGLAWMAILIGPSAIVIVILGEVSDRYVYLPLAGFAVALVVALRALFQSFPRFTLAFIIGVGIWAVFWLVISWLQVPVWQDNRALYTHAVRMEPGSSMAVYRLGYTYLKEGDLKTAEPLFEKAIQLDDRNVRAMNNLSVVYLRTGRYSQGAKLLRRVIAVSKNTHFRAWNNLATAYFAMGEKDKGCRALQGAFAINPNYQLAQRAWKKQCQEFESE